MPFRSIDPGAEASVAQDAGTTAAKTDLRFADLAWAGKNAWWRYLLSILMIAAVTILVQLGLAHLTARLGVRAEPAVSGGETPTFAPVDLDTFIFVMLSIAVMLPATLVTVRWLHRRPMRTLLTARPRFGWATCAGSAGVVLATVAIMAVVWKAVQPDAIRVVFDPAGFFLYLPFILILTPLQVLAEEVVFRGYILQGVARLTGLWLGRLIVPAILFVVVHIPNEEFRIGGWWAAADYAVIALYLGYLTLRGNGLEYATGVHLGLNASFFIIIGYGLTWLQTPSIFLFEGYDFRVGLIGTLVVCAVHYLTVMRRLGSEGDPL